MTKDEKLKLQHELLLNECAQMYTNIQRCFQDMTKLIVLVFPVLTSTFTFAISGKTQVGLNLDLLVPLFSILMSLLVISFNSAWIQLLTFSSYKYTQILPRLYAICGRSGPNHGVFITSQGVAKSLAGAIIAQMVTVPIGAATTWLTWHQETQSPFSLPAYLAFGVLVVTSIRAWAFALQTVRNQSSS